MDFKKIFGGRYFVSMDPSWAVETPENRAEFRANDEEKFYYEIKGRRGTAYPYSETMIAVTLPTRAARRLMKLMGSQLVRLQHADDAMTFKADTKHAAALVRFIKPQRLRPLTAEHKAVLASRLACYRFQGSDVAQTNHSSKNEQVSIVIGAAS